MKALTTLFVIGMFLTTVAMADDVDDVKAAVQSFFVAINAGDADAMIQTRMAGYSIFTGGGLLERSGSLEDQKRDFQASADSGFRRNLQIRHLEVKVYGNAAVVTGYLTGTITTADGTTQQVRQERTGVWIKQGGRWGEAHRHQSPLSTPQ